MEAVLTHWLTWLLVFGLSVTGIMILRLLEKRDTAKDIERIMRQTDKMAAHGSPALGLMPMVFRSASTGLRTYALEVILPIAAFNSALIFIVTLLVRLLS